MQFQKSMKPKLKIIKPTDFRHVKDVTLNRQEIIETSSETFKIKGTKIGSIVWYRNRLFYLTYREPIHVMRKYKGAFGIDEGVLNHILEKEIELGKFLQIPDFILFIIFHYRGKKKRRYYIIDPMKIDEEGIRAAYTKDTGNYLETYGNQVFYEIRKMGVLGYDEDDVEVLRRR